MNKIYTYNVSKRKSFFERISVDPFFLLMIITLLIYSAIITWSACGGNVVIMKHKIIQIILGLIVMFILSQFPPRIYENCALYLYVLCIIMLIMVYTPYGHSSKGAHRWLNIGIISFQPSEIIKLILPLTLARFINRSVYPLPTKNIFISLILTFIPTLLVAKQPDLGTSILIALSGLLILFFSGIKWKFIGITIFLTIIFIPILWFTVLHEYQRARILMLFHPEKDPLGAGYHIIQSKIAIGSGGLCGKGWLHGTQGQLNFLPERHTDFIFCIVAEEFGLLGVLVVIITYILLIIRGLTFALRAQTMFGRTVISNLMAILFVYVFVNIGMVSGIVPVVGIPLPLMSYGGSALIALMAGFGIVMSIHTHRRILSHNI